MAKRKKQTSQSIVEKTEIQSSHSSDFVFKETLSNIPASSFSDSDRDLEKELFGKKGIQEKIDAVENELGLGKGPAKSKINLEYKNIILIPELAEDQVTLNNLLNDKKKYAIIMWRETWTVNGQFKIFVIYSEDLDADKNTKKEEEAKEEGTDE